MYSLVEERDDDVLPPNILNGETKEKEVNFYLNEIKIINYNKLDIPRSR